MEECQDQEASSDGISSDSRSLAALYEKFTFFRESKYFCDLVLIAGSERFPCHKCILAAQSEWFHAMFTNGMKESTQDEITLEVESNVLRTFLDYLYSGKIIINSSNVFMVLESSAFFQISKLTEMCEDFLLDTLSPSNLIQYYDTAFTFNLPRLLKKCHGTLTLRFQVLQDTPDFFTINPKQLKALLEDDSLNVASEDVVFNMVCDWVNHDPKERVKYALDLFDAVRLPLVEPVLLTKIGSQSFARECEGLLEKTLNALHLALKGTHHCVPRHSFGLMRARRFPIEELPVGYVDNDEGWWYEDSDFDTLVIEPTYNIALKGFTMFTAAPQKEGDDSTAADGEYTALIIIERCLSDDHDASVIIYNKNHQYPAVPRPSLSTPPFHIHPEHPSVVVMTDVMLDRPIPLRKNVKYVVKALITGPPSFMMKRGQTATIDILQQHYAEAPVEKLPRDRKGPIIWVHDFQNNETFGNMTNIQRGQFAEFLYTLLPSDAAFSEDLSAALTTPRERKHN
eukprot:GCRY01004014.1.p1 GENE.GCRY01004014.1~~GCRY01004014.1.p1  ORF type:complete len:512 (+),score=148.00 GCRY01004014.1:245-1780(+)